ncbi:hypothetical protein JA33_205 [Dickeya phage vB_DsoM_JA33]|uniref:Uncharacterized protein n=3 Tax=Salmondvirus TaxID=2733130 RepID=A0A386K6M5_9CAUD|nr:hypothetical protein HOU08_gp206 [Dickeya phage vB_DsoM_JA29]YP_009813649.1 hypothetical protein HOU32_gp204 [Dickeya phage vB_DsoM_JA11]AXG66932.1 hypothetical protein JA29_206 [Dickeya phage vB_DsoM_JA29]AXG67579.1 hypothetical protein JA33_205 [Dickeya phage vB_DsoM_JA33]AYD80009.1 hypothetical protein JA11_204 [Dickeya phage vB_DsoM_JA11]
MTNVPEIQTQTAIIAFLEAVFKAEISYTPQGHIPTNAKGEVLREFEFKSDWITFNKLLKDLHEQIGAKVYHNTDPNGCRICIRPFDTQNLGDRNYTSFIFAVDPLGYVPSDCDATPIRKHRLPIFSEHEIFESLAEFHGIHVKRGALEKELLVSEFTVRWYGLTEFLTQCRLFLDGTLVGKQGTIYLIEHNTVLHDQPARNETCFKIAHELSY